MSEIRLKEIINFAVEKEQEAVDFYTEYEGKVKNQAITEELNKLADMERGHKKRLQNLEVETIGISEPEKVADLKIADNIVTK